MNIDPACGSGNFLIVAYEELRKLEFEVLKLLYDYQENVFLDAMILVKPEQFNGIEIEDFPVQIANLSMILMKHQMDQEISNYFGVNAVDFPIRDTAHIVQANALQIDWNDVVPVERLDYIMGNPPFIGARLMDSEQKSDMERVASKIPGIGNLDYVAGWYIKAARVVFVHKQIRVAFVSTNSICQGEQAAILWRPIFTAYGCKIDFGYRTFKWGNEAKNKAAVHCVIVSYSHQSNRNLPKTIYESFGNSQKAYNINGYLIDAPSVFVDSRSKPLWNVDRMIFGNMPNDGGHLILSEDEKTSLIKQCPSAAKVIKQYVGSREFINGTKRWCLWITPSDFSLIYSCNPIIERIEQVKKSRKESNRKTTVELADKAYSFGEIRQPAKEYLLVPRVSSENRRYIPIGFLSPDIIASDATLLIPEGSLYTFALLSSNVHMAWMRAVAGRLKSDYRYSASIVYNNFPWPQFDTKYVSMLEETGFRILEIRESYPKLTYAELYNDLLMPPELRKAHQANDKAVWEAYGKAWDITSEEDCVAHLMKLYAEVINAEITVK